jgi:hypothetical protein
VSSRAYLNCGSKTGWLRQCEGKRERDPGKLRGDERTGIAAFVATWQYNLLLVEVATEIGINQAALHLRQRSQQDGIPQAGVEAQRSNICVLKILTQNHTS